MTIEIDGGRSSDAAWQKARLTPVDKLREMSTLDISWASDEAAAEKLARRLYASDLTQHELVAKCVKLGKLAADWMRRMSQDGEVSLVRLRCLRGLFDVHILEGGELHRLEVREDVVDDLLQSGSREAAESLDRLFAANLGRFPISKAS